MKYKIIFIAVIIYLILVNLLFIILDSDLFLYFNNEYYENYESGIGLKTDLVGSAQVIKNRWYGTIIEFHSDKTISHLNLFKIKYLKIPLYKSFNFIPFHIIFLMLIFFFIFRKSQKPKDI